MGNCSSPSTVATPTVPAVPVKSKVSGYISAISATVQVTLVTVTERTRQLQTVLNENSPFPREIQDICINYIRDKENLCVLDNLESECLCLQKHKCLLCKNNIYCEPITAITAITAITVVTNHRFISCPDCNKTKRLLCNHCNSSNLNCSNMNQNNSVCKVCKICFAIKSYCGCKIVTVISTMPVQTGSSYTYTFPIYNSFSTYFGSGASGASGTSVSSYSNTNYSNYPKSERKKKSKLKVKTSKRSGISKYERSPKSRCSDQYCTKSCKSSYSPKSYNSK